MSMKKTKHKIDYLTIPIHMKVHFRGKTIGAHVLVGPELNFALSGKFSTNFVDKKGRVIQGAEVVLNQNGVESNGEIEFGSSINDDLTNFDFGFAFGGGLSFELETGKITLDARLLRRNVKLIKH